MSSDVSMKAANNLRVLSAAMVEKAQSGHPGGPMGGADFLHILYSEFLNFDPDDMAWPFRDRFFLDPGHLSAGLYSILHLIGTFKKEELMNFRQWGSPTPGHPELEPEKGVENTSGPLGMGHSFAVGAAIAEKFLTHRFGDWMNHTIYTYVSDGGIQEEISHSTARIAGHLGLSNLVMFFDSNDIQLSTKTNVVTCEDTAKRYESWHWHVITIDGHDHDQIRNALKEANAETEKPTLIIGRTVMGKGAVDEEGNSFEHQVSTHGKPLSKAGASFEKTVEKLGGNPENPFETYPEVAEYYKKVIENKRKEAQNRKETQKQWAKDNPELSKKLDKFLKLDISDFDFDSLKPEEDDATRNSSGYVLSKLVNNVENLIVASADLSGSDKTEGYLKGTQAFQKGDFSGAFLQVGVSELTMAAVMNGMALHGGVIPACGTFFVFSDYMKPAVRLAALMELPIIYIWSHDSFRVGEDGPTHQPVEQEAQIRLMEQLKNHSGKNSILALRPADSAETVTAWQMGLENLDSPTALILSRQKIKNLPANGESRLTVAKEARKGAYIVYEPDDEPDVILVGNGSEVSTMYDAAQILEKEKGIKSRLVSAISEGLFRNQSTNYQKEVIPEGIPVFGVTAGLPASLQGLVGQNGEIFGMEHFGHSAPAKVLDEKLGYIPEKIAEKIMNYLERSAVEETRP
ncbi:MAG: transketolase family protein [Bacteroidota bacterium]